MADTGVWVLVAMHLLASIGAAVVFAKLLRLLSEPPDQDDEGRDEGDGPGGGGGGSRGPRGPWGGGLPLAPVKPWPTRLRAVTPVDGHLATRTGRSRHRRQPSAPQRPAHPRRKGSYTRLPSAFRRQNARDALELRRQAPDLER